MLVVALSLILVQVILFEVTCITLGVGARDRTCSLECVRQVLSYATFPDS